MVVIGSGPAGEGAALTAAKSHRSVAIVRRYFEVGGGCTHWGTIPSKACRHAVKILHDLRRNPLLREFHDASKLTYPQLLASAGKVIEARVASRRRFYERNRVPVFFGEASFVDANTLEIQPPTGKPTRISGKHIVIAAGFAAVPSHRSGLQPRAYPRQRFHPALRPASVLRDHLWCGSYWL